MPIFSKHTGLFYILQAGLILFLFSTVSYSQDHQHDHDHSEAHNELAIGVGLALISENPGASPTLHFHAIKGILPKFGVGLGYEIIFGDELHQSIAAMASIKPIGHLDLNIGPGVVLPYEDEPLALLIKTEAAITFRVTDHLHAGPVLDMAWSEHGFHLITGLHVGFDL